MQNAAQQPKTRSDAASESTLEPGTVDTQVSSRRHSLRLKHNSNHELEATDRLISKLLNKDLHALLVEAILFSTEEELEQILGIHQKECNCFHLCR